jgi:hypothetical protein
MRGPFERRCYAHIDHEVTSSISHDGHETVWCATGHKAKQWYVLDADDAKIAIGYLHKTPQILDDELLRKITVNTIFQVMPPQPDHACRRGHTDWYLNPDDRYRCRACKRESYQKNRELIAAKYKEKTQRRKNV